MFKRTLQIFIGIALTMQLAGCFYYAGDRRYHPYWYHHPNEDRGPNVNVNIHG